MQHRPPSSPTLRLDISRQETSQGQDQAAGRARRAHGRAPHSPACRRRKPYTPAPLPPPAPSTTSINIISQEPTLNLPEPTPPNIYNILLFNYIQHIRRRRYPSQTGVPTTNTKPQTTHYQHFTKPSLS